MADQAVLSVPIDSSAFDTFARKFDAHQKELAKMSSAWGKAGKFVDAFGFAGAKVSLQMSKNSQLAKTITDEQKKQSVALSGADRMWTSVNRSSSSFAHNIAESTKSLLKWTTILEGVTGLLGVGGLFGLNRLAGSVGNERRGAQGLGLSIGQQKAFGLSFGKLVNADSYLNFVNGIETDQSKQWISNSLGVRMSGDTSKDSVAMLDAIRALAKRTPLRNLQQIMSSRGIDMGTDELRRLHDGSDSDYALYKSQYGSLSQSLNISDPTAAKWQEFMTKLSAAGEKIEKVFVDALQPLLPSLSKLSDSFTTLLGAFLNSHFVKEGIEKLGDWLNSLAGTIDKTDFKSFFEGFIDDLKALGVIIHGIAHPYDAITDAFTPTGKGGVNWAGGWGNPFKNPQDEAARRNLLAMGGIVDKQYGLPAGLLETQALLESNGNVNIGNSAKGAVGPMQIMPENFKKFGMDPRNAQQALTMAAMLDQDAMKRYGGDVSKVLASYNWGQGNLDKDIGAHGSDWLKYAPAETQKYIANAGVTININNNTGGSATVTASQLGASQ